MRKDHHITLRVAAVDLQRLERLRKRLERELSRRVSRSEALRIAVEAVEGALTALPGGVRYLSGMTAQDEGA